MNKRKVLYLSWILAFFVVLQSSPSRKKETTAFQGIADTREVIINSEKAVEIRAIHAVPGQEIQKGQLIVELERPELTMKINEISHQLEELKSLQIVNNDEIKSKIRQLSGEKTALISQIDHKIHQIRSRHQFNKEIISGLKSISQNGTPPKASVAIEIEIRNLEQERQLTQNRFQTQIDDLNTKAASPETPESIRQESLKKELELLHEEEKALLILASIDGIIGSIHCKTGEKVSPFEPILTLHPRSPSHVRGYINENFHNLASVGDRVRVAALTSGGKKTEGEIVGVGSRIVEYPLRLKKRPELPLWGREVEIHLPEDNSFLLGEKVMIETAEYSETNYLVLIKRWLHLKTYTEKFAAHNEKNDNPEQLSLLTFPIMDQR